MAAFCLVTSFFGGPPLQPRRLAFVFDDPFLPLSLESATVLELMIFSSPGIFFLATFSPFSTSSLRF